LREKFIFNPSSQTTVLEKCLAVLLSEKTLLTSLFVPPVAKISPTAQQTQQNPTAQQNPTKPNSTTES
jgi:hypothetical protein